MSWSLSHDTKTTQSDLVVFLIKIFTGFNTNRLLGLQGFIWFGFQIFHVCPPTTLAFLFYEDFPSHLSIFAYLSPTLFKNALLLRYVIFPWFGVGNKLCSLINSKDKILGFGQNSKTVLFRIFQRHGYFLFLYPLLPSRYLLLLDNYTVNIFIELLVDEVAPPFLLCFALGWTA